MTSTSLSGIDVSKFQGAIDWQSVKSSGITFAFARALEGETVHDSEFAANWHGMHEAGLIRGAYDFYVVEDSPESQAKIFSDLVSLKPGDLVPMVDIEQGSITSKNGSVPANMVSNLHQYLTLLEAHFGIKPIIYTNARFWNTYMDDSFSDYPLWLAEYGVKAPALPNGWNSWKFWQYSDSGDVPGINGAVDLDTFNGNLADLEQFRI